MTRIPSLALTLALLAGACGGDAPPAGADMTAVIDIRMPDFRPPPDFTPPPDMTVVPDMTALPDMTVLPDIVTVPDLTVVPDMTILPDLVTVPDLLTLPDLVVVPDLVVLPDLAPSCSDNVKNGNESDIDCGGSCPKCAVGRACNTTADCSNSICDTTGKSCRAPLHCNEWRQLGVATDGVQTIDPDGPGGNAPFAALCDMTTAGGGWTLGFLKNSAHAGNYPAFAHNNTNLAALAISPATASSSNMGIAGWTNLNTFPYTTMRLAAYQSGARTYLSSDIAKSSLRIAFGQPGYYLYNDANGYYWCGGPASYTDAGQGQVNPPPGAPADCKGHGSLGDGFDFGTPAGNQGLTMCGTSASNWMYGQYGGPTLYSYPTPGAAYAFWVR